MIDNERDEALPRPALDGDEHALWWRTVDEDELRQLLSAIEGWCYESMARWADDESGPR